MALILAVIALVAAGLHLGPHLTRRDIFFGYTVAAGFRNTVEAQAIARRHALEVWLFAAAAAAFAASSPTPAMSGTVILAQTLAGTVAFVRARSAARPHAVAASSVREAELSARPSLPGGWIGQAGPFLILAAAAFYVGLRWDDIPAEFPTHWNLAGRPDGWTGKSVAGVARGFLAGLMACGMMFAIAYGVLHGSRLPRTSGGAGRESRAARRVNLTMLLIGEYLIALLIAWTSTVAMFAPARPQLPLALRIAPFAIAVIGALAIMWVRSGAPAPATPPVGDATPDAQWKLGLFYYNPSDAALFVEKRIGLGYTMNLGNRLAWVMIGAGLLAWTLILSLG